jgi:hypothetical protein
MIDDFKTIFRRNRDLITLGWLISIILIFPYFEGTAFGEMLLVILISALLLSALYSVSDRPSQVAAGFLLAVPTLLCAWTEFFVPSDDIWVALLLSLTVFLSYITLSILHRVFKAKEVTLVEMIRAVTSYIMIGLAFGMVYLLVEALSPDSFQFTYGTTNIQSLIYFSFGALSTAGFGDITAISPVARSLVIIEMLIGVMYMAVLIGLLVNAHYSARYSTPRERWIEGREGAKKRFRAPFLSSGGTPVLLAIAVMLNMSTALVAAALNLPLFLDTWGTSLGVILGGFPVGAAAGILSNVILGLTIWDPASILFAACSVLVAAMTWLFWSRGWVDVRTPWLLLAAGIATGIVNAFATFSISTAFGQPPYEGTLAIYRFFTGILPGPVMPGFATSLLVEIIDKTLCIVLAAVASVFLTDFFEKEQNKDESGKEEEIPPGD